MFQIPATGENLRPVHLHSSLVGSKRLLSVGSPEVIPMTDTFQANDPVLHILHGFSSENVLIHILHNHPFFQFSNMEHRPDMRQ
jgi:hypothetical protein